jgi:hypothetical protein
MRLLPHRLSSLKWNNCASSFEEVDRLRNLSAFTPSLGDDKDFLSAASSESPTPSWNIVNKFSRAPLASDDWSFTGNSFTRVAGFEDHIERPFHDSPSPTQERAIAMLDSSLDLPLIDRDSSLRHLRDFDLMPVISSLLSSGSSKRESDDPQRMVAEAKPRTRRPPVNPILKGPNPYGRAGKLRCELCRNKRQGVNSRQPSWW